MKTTILVLLTAALVGQATLGVQPNTPDFTQKEPRVGEAPLWIPLRSVLTPDGDIGLSAFPSHVEASIRLSLKANPHPSATAFSPLTYLEDCGQIAVTTSGGRSPERSLDELARNAKAMFSGRILSAEVGFLSGVPGSLLELSVLDVAFGSVPASKHVFIFYPFAHATAGRYLICKADLRYPFRPQVGEILAIAAVFEPLDQAGSLFQPGPSQVFLESNGSLQGSTYLSGEPLPSSAKALLQTTNSLRSSAVVR